MALTRTALYQEINDNGGAGFGTGALTTSSFAASSNRLLVVWASAIMAADSGMDGSDLTISDSEGLTWTSRIATGTSSNWSYGGRVWTAPITTGASMTVTIDCGTHNVDNYRVEVYEYEDYNTSSPVGSTIAGTLPSGDGSHTITLGSAPASDSEVLAFLTATVGGGNGSATPGTGWTELYDNFITDYGHHQSQYRGSSTSTSVTWDDVLATGSSNGVVSCALEIKASTGGAGPPSPQQGLQGTNKGFNPNRVARLGGILE